MCARAYSLLEDGGFRVFYCLSDLLLCGVWANDAVLSLSGSLRVSSEFRFEVLIPVDGGLQPAVDLADLWCVARVPRLWLGLDVLDACDQGAVSRHDLRAEVCDFARGHVWAGKDLLECALEVVELTIELVKGAVDFAAFVEDGIGVCAAAGRLTVRLHFYVVGYKGIS